MSNLKWYSLLLALLTITFLLQVAAKYQYLPLTNHYVYDSYTYEMRVLLERNLGTFADSFTTLNSFFYQIGPFSFFIINSFLLLACIRLSKIFECISEKSVSIAKFCIVTNPYFLIGAIGPNKETVLLFLSLLAFKLFFHRHSFIAFLGLLVAMSAIFVRPVFGLVLVITILLTPFIKSFKNPITLFLYILIAYFIANTTPLVNEVLNDAQGEELASYQGSNLYQIALFLKVLNQHPLLQFPAFAIKTCLILITPIARPNSFFSVPIPILDWGYSYMAYLLLPFNLALLLLIFKKKLANIHLINFETQVLILYVLIGILTTIVNGNITFRYIFPYSPIILSLFYLHNLKIRNRIIILSLSMIVTTFLITAVALRKQTEIDVSVKPQFMSWF